MTMETIKGTLGDVKTMNMMRAENLRILVGDKVVGLAKIGQITIAEDDIKLKKQSEPWRMPDIRQSWNITCNAMIKEPGDMVRDLLNGKGKWDVTIERNVGKLPRKMKKALRSQCMTKWKRKVLAYIFRRQIHIHNAEMVVREEQMEILSKQADE